MANGTGKENDFTKSDTMGGSDYFRAVIGGSSRLISLTNTLSVLNPLLNSTLNIVTSTQNYFASAANDVILMDVTAATRSVTLPAASANTGVLLQIKKIDAGTNDITVQTVSGNIDGSATATMSGSGGAMPGSSFVSDGSNWFILNA